MRGAVFERRKATAAAPAEPSEPRAIEALLCEAERTVPEAAFAVAARGEADVEPALDRAIDALERARARAA